MTQMDYIILAILLWGAYRGWIHGLFKEIVSTVGFIAGLFVAYRLYDSFGDYLAPHISAHTSVAMVVARVLAFIVLWVLTPILLGFFATLLTKTLKGLHVGFINSLLGLLLGTAKYGLLLSFVFCAMNALHIVDQEKKDASKLYRPVTAIAEKVFENVKWYATHTKPSSEEPADTIWIPIHHEEG